MAAHSSESLGDILSLALQQTGVGSLNAPKLHMEHPSSILNEAANTIDDSLLSSDIGSLTQGLLTTLARPASSVAARSAPQSQLRQAVKQEGEGMATSLGPGAGCCGNLVDLNSLPDFATGAFGGGMEGGPLDLSDLEDDINLDELLSGGDSMPPVSLATGGVGTSGIQGMNALLFPPTNGPSFLENGTGLEDDDLSTLLSATGTDYLESITQDMVAKPMSNVPSPPYIPPVTPLSITGNYSFVRQVSTGRTSTNSALKFDVNAVAQQLTQSYPTRPPFHRSNSVATPFMVSPSASGTVLASRGSAMAAGGIPRGRIGAGSMYARVPMPPTGARGVGVLDRRMSLPAAAIKQSQTAEEDSDEEDEQFSAADTYANYRPAKLKLGHTHPDPVVESSSLSSVDPPQVWFDLKLPSPVIEEAKLSSLQLESVVYACQQHMNILADGSRAGFLVGDGAGVGKGRTIAGIIYQNYMEGRKKAVWLSVSNDLKYDAIRDLRDIGARKIQLYSLSKFHYGKISGKRNGRVRKGVIFATYSSLIGESSSGGKYRTRLNQLLHWLGPHFEGVIVFDECHKAKNLVPTGSSKPSKTGLTVLQLQKKLPKARIVYCSATGASEPRNMAYMSRLGIWGLGTPFPSFLDFIKAVERRGVGAMEIVAMDMKLRGLYAARQLSFSGVTFSINEVPLSEKFVEMYNASVELWMEMYKLFLKAADLMDYEKKQLKSMWGQFWAAHQRFFKYLCIAAKVPAAIELAKKSLQDGKCVVIGLQSTGEARTLEQLEQNEGELTGFISTAKGVVETLIKRHFPAPAEVGIDWSLFANDPTLPSNCRKRKRGVRRRQPIFEAEEFSSSDDDDSSSGSPERSDSAVESSSEDEDDDRDTSESSSEGGSGSEEEDKEDLRLFGINIDEPRKKSKPKAKKRKKSPSLNNKRNFSIKPPPSSSSSRGKGPKRTKTGFNSKSLKFEPVGSPKEPVPQRNVMEQRRQSITAARGLEEIGSPPLSQKPSLQMSMASVGEGQSLLNLMSTSAMATGSQSGLRNVTIKKMKEELLSKLEVLSPHLPANTLDELIDGLGGPQMVAEMTGRRGRVVSLSDGSVQYQLRSESDVSLELLNVAEKQRFMDGEKIIAIISEAASSGISLQSDKRVKNHRRRVHITLELPWSADKAIQQFGRTHRSNQVSAPEYVFLISALSGEQRFASIVAKRLESLGALTHGDRRATETRDLSKYNVDTKYGRSALEAVLKSILGTDQPLVKSEDYPPKFFEDCRTALVGVALLTKDERGLFGLDKEANQISRFLNRILGLPVGLQNQLFAYFTDTLAAVIQQARRTGRWDCGIFDFGASGEHVEVVGTQEFVGDAAFGTSTTQLHKVRVERGMSFSEAVQKLEADFHPGEGFYLSKRVRNDKQTAVLLKVADPSTSQFMVCRPNTGLQARAEKIKDLLKKYSKVEPVEAEKCWTEQYESSLSVCTHAFWQGRCRLSLLNHQCEVGLRRRTYYVLGGSVLGVWTHVEGVFSRHGGHNSRMQIARVKTPSRRLVGILVPTSCVEDMKQTLNRIALQAAGSLDNPVELQ